MGEQPANPESSKEQFLQEIIAILGKLRELGVDFEESDIEHLAAMEEDELENYVYVALLEAGVDNPEEVMIGTGIVEAFRKYNQAEIAERTGHYLVDEVDELDRQRGTGSYPREIE